MNFINKATVLNYTVSMRTSFLSEGKAYKDGEAVVLKGAPEKSIKMTYDPDPRRDRFFTNE
jgi:hypothetical protein